MARGVVRVKVLRDLWELARAVPFVIRHLLVERLSMPVRDFHEPFDGVCIRCRTKAPCQPYMDATERVYEARIAIADYFASRA
jgi:hypothetical protein